LNTFEFDLFVCNSGPEGASMFLTAMDFNMENANGGMERTEALHREYLEKAGLHVTGVYRPDDDVSEGVIEAELV
jgi:hypothetical protein